MTTSSQGHAPSRFRWSNVIDQTVVDGYGAERITVSRVSSEIAGEAVFIETADSLTWLTPTQAADLAEALKNVSGMATSTYEAQFMAKAVRESLAKTGVTQVRACLAAGVSRHRLRRILSGEVPMTMGELKALSAVRP